jgi:hypothetical protein
MLMMNGFDPDFALGLDRAERLAFCVMVGELNGGQFNWLKRKWDK